MQKRVRIYAIQRSVKGRAATSECGADHIDVQRYGNGVGDATESSRDVDFAVTHQPGSFRFGYSGELPFGSGAGRPGLT